jgi:hypothetical protein
MLGLILIYFIGRSFYRLADYYNRSKWGFAILGIAVYYASQLIYAFLLGFAIGSTRSGVDQGNIFMIALLAVALGGFTTWALHAGLKSNWGKKGAREEKSDLLDDF